MRKNFNLDETLLRQARKACGAKTDTDAVRLGLEALIRHAAYQKLRTFLGTEKGPIVDVPRRREPPAKESGPINQPKRSVAKRRAA